MSRVGFYRRFLYRPVLGVPGEYYVLSREEPRRVLGRVRVYTDRQWSHNFGEGRYTTRESAARELAEANAEALQRLRSSAP